MWARALAGIFPGFFLSAGLLGLISWMLPGPWQSTLVAGALAFFPLWVSVIAVGFFFRSGRSAWIWLSVYAIAANGLFHGLRWLGWMQ